MSDISGSLLSSSLPLEVRVAIKVLRDMKDAHLKKNPAWVIALWKHYFALDPAVVALAQAEIDKSEIAKSEMAKATESQLATEVKPAKPLSAEPKQRRNAMALPGQISLSSAAFRPLLERDDRLKEVNDAILSYEAADNPKDKRAALQKADMAATTWLNKYGRQNPSLKKLVNEFVFDYIGPEISERIGSVHGERYLANVVNSRRKANYESEDPGEKYAFRALTPDASSDVRKNVVGQGLAINNPYQLSNAEIAAIRIFTGRDYGYINPTTAKDSEWLEENKTRTGTQDAFVRGASDDVMMEEGPTHTGMAIRGLNKLPLYTGVVYRGATSTKEEIKVWKNSGLHFPSFASASTDRSTAENWACSHTDNEKPVAVVFVIFDANGRDIRELSVLPKEDEVLLLPNSSFPKAKVNDCKKLGYVEIEVRP